MLSAVGPTSSRSAPVPTSAHAIARPSAGTRRTKTRCAPSGDHRGTIRKSLRPFGSRDSSRPLSASRITIAQRRSVVNSTAAIRRPSGDSAGANSRVPRVTSRVAPVARSVTRTSENERWPQRVSYAIAAHAIRVPATECGTPNEYGAGVNSVFTTAESFTALAARTAFVSAGTVAAAGICTIE